MPFTVTAKQELALHGQCDEIPLEFLSEKEVAEYLSHRLARHEWPPELARALHRRTDGNPLFLVNTVADLIVQGQLHDVDGQWQLAVPVKELAANGPETLWQMVQKQMERLTPDEQAMLTVGSAAGVEFSAAVASAAGIAVQEGERRCEALARRGQFLRATGVAEWPDGTVAGRYAFMCGRKYRQNGLPPKVSRRSSLSLASISWESAASSGRACKNSCRSSIAGRALSPSSRRGRAAPARVP